MNEVNEQIMNRNTGQSTKITTNYGTVFTSISIYLNNVIAKPLICVDPKDTECLERCAYSPNDETNLQDSKESFLSIYLINIYNSRWLALRLNIRETPSCFSILQALGSSR